MTSPYPTQAIEEFLSEVNFNQDGLIPAIAQQYDSGEILMMAWMNEEAIRITLAEQVACYWTRSRNKLWRKGESSGQTQKLHNILLDCDGDTVILKVDQTGVACHTGRHNCFYKELTSEGIIEAHPVIISPDDLYKK